MTLPSITVPNEALHLLLGPRTAFLIGSTRLDGSPHLCAASNVTNVSKTPQIMAIALWPTWETTSNIQRTGELTINLMDVDHLDDIWIVGSKYSKVEVQPSDNKFEVGGLTPLPSLEIQPAGVQEALAMIECRVLRMIEDVTDHVLFLAQAVAGRCDKDAFDSQYVIDTSKAHPPMQITRAHFAQCEPAPNPDTAACSELAATRRRN